MTEKLADHVYGEVQPGYNPTLCKTCGASIAWGLTKNDKRAPFDNPRSEHGWVNHWISLL